MSTTSKPLQDRNGPLDQVVGRHGDDGGRRRDATPGGDAPDGSTVASHFDDWGRRMCQRARTECGGRLLRPVFADEPA